MVGNDTYNQLGQAEVLVVLRELEGHHQKLQALELVSIIFKI